jgi:hypothetical protein
MRQQFLLLLSVLLLGLLAACQQSAPPAPVAAAKVFVVEEGLYEVTGADLQAANLGWGDFDPARLQLLYRGQEEPLWVQGRGSDLRLRFYGRASESRYSQENVYWLQLGEGPGQRMEEQGSGGTEVLSGAKEQEQGSYLATAHAEENRLYSPRVTEGEHWFWESLPAPATKTFTVTLTALAPLTSSPLYPPPPLPTLRLRSGQAWGEGEGGWGVRVRVEVWGSTEGPSSPDHHLHLSVNGQPVADEAWDGQGRRTVEAALPAGLLSEGSNVVTLAAPGDTGVAADIVFVDWIEVRYPRHFVATADWLSFESDGGLQRLSGFRGTTVVYDVTQPEKPALVASVQQERGTAGTTVTLWTEPGHRYLAVGPTGFLSPARLARAVASPDLRSPHNRADYIAIAPATLLEALQPLLHWREGQGLKVMAVPVEALYDEFNYGLPEPEAIRSFLRYAAESWQKPAPQYVLLVGDATYDPRGYLAPAGANLLPTFLVPTVFGGETASDTAFVRLDDDPWPDMAIGRVPARTSQQVRTWVEKTLAYERGTADSSWQRRVILVADGQDEFFRTQSQALLAQIPVDYAVVEFYPEPGALNANRELRRLMEPGSLLVNYIGHGSISQWGKDLIFTTADAAALANGKRLPVVLNMTCLTGLFTHPKVESLAEGLLWAERGGAVAVLAPTSLTLPGDQSFFNQALFQALLRDRIPTLGQAIVQAKRQTPANSAEVRDVVETFTLFGDPALRLAYPTTGG